MKVCGALLLVTTVSQAAWAQPTSLVPPGVIASDLPAPSSIILERPVAVVPPPVTWALLPGHWQLDGARYVWVAPDTRLRPVQARPFELGENVWRDGKWVYVPPQFAGPSGQ